MSESETQLDGTTLTVAGLTAIAAGGRCRIPPDRLRYAAGQHAKLARLLADGTPVYGLNTGVGQMVNYALDAAQLREFQRNLIRSHSVGSGPPFSPRDARAILAARTNALAKGYSAVRPALLERLAAFLNNNVTPVIPQQGSLGASGDLAPLAHLALAIIGEGEAFDAAGRPAVAAEVLAAHGMGSFELGEKEGLALINGCSATAGAGALVVADAWDQVRQAEAIAALGLQVLRASAAPFAQCGHDLARPFPGQTASAAAFRLLIADSRLMVEHAALERQLAAERPSQDPVRGTRVYLQKAYSLRAGPQIFGAVRDAVAHAQRMLEVELNSAADNPLLVGDEVFHGANFHGAPVACPLDYLMLSLLQVGVQSERRLNRLVHPALKGDQSPVLVAGEVGLECGFAGAQYLATSLVAEARTIGPASTQSIPSNGDNQDVVSMGLIGARNARRVWDLNATVLAVEALAAAHAVDLLEARDALSPAGAATYRSVRDVSPPVRADRGLYADVEAVGRLVRRGGLLGPIHQAVGGPLP
jgi:tyrosine 2,3-aminomutase